MSTHSHSLDIFCKSAELSTWEQSSEGRYTVTSWLEMEPAGFKLSTSVISTPQSLPYFRTVQ